MQRLFYETESKLGIPALKNLYPLIITLIKNKDDLIQAGYMGLVMAFNNYDSNSNTKFSTYEYKYIYGEMCKLIREDKPVKINRDIKKLKNTIEKAKSLLEQRLNREPSNKELSDFLEIDIKDIDEALKETITFSIDQNEINLYDIIPNNNIDISKLVEIKTTLESLDKKSRDMFNYSLYMTESEIGKIYQMNQVKVSRTLKKIKNNIRQKMN